MSITLSDEELKDMEDRLMFLDALLQCGVDDLHIYDEAVMLCKQWKANEQNDQTI